MTRFLFNFTDVLRSGMNSDGSWDLLQWGIQWSIIPFTKYEDVFFPKTSFLVTEQKAVESQQKPLNTKEKKNQIAAPAINRLHLIWKQETLVGMFRSKLNYLIAKAMANRDLVSTEVLFKKTLIVFYLETKLAACVLYRL